MAGARCINMSDTAECRRQVAGAAKQGLHVTYSVSMEKARTSTMAETGCM